MPQKFTHIQYMGDSVYSGLDSCQRIWIWTDNGEGKQNLICLEDSVLNALIKYYRHAR